MRKDGLVAGQITVIPNWPDRELVTDGAVRKKKIGLPRKLKKGGKNIRPFDQQFKDGHDVKFRVLYSGNLGLAHPVQTILDAAQILSGAHDEIEFVFVGDGANVDRLAEERAKRGLENIRFLPFQPVSRIKNLMESGDIHLISMQQDIGGMLVPCKLYSAMAVERPCVLIGPENSETAQIITDFKAGAVVPQGHGQELADVILRYRSDPDHWFEAHQGAAEAGRTFLPEESIKAFIDRAQDVIDKNSFN